MSQNFRQPRGYNTPIVIENTGTGERAYDLKSRLLKERIVFIDSVIDDELATSVISQLLFLEYQDENEPIKIYINSPGGSVYQSLAILDTMKTVAPKIHTICVGMAASAAGLLLSSGDCRMAQPRSRILIHQPWVDQIGGQVTDLQIQLEELKKTKDEVTQILAENTKQSFDKVLVDCERDYWMNAKEALDYGIIDKISEYAIKK
jgi:ATP-dependent Clp protease protease subunit